MWAEHTLILSTIPEIKCLTGLVLHFWHFTSAKGEIFTPVTMRSVTHHRCVTYWPTQRGKITTSFSLSLLQTHLIMTSELNETEMWNACKHIYISEVGLMAPNLWEVANRWMQYAKTGAHTPKSLSMNLLNCSGAGLTAPITGKFPTFPRWSRNQLCIFRKPKY